MLPFFFRKRSPPRPPTADPGSDHPGPPGFWRVLTGFLCHPEDRPFVLADLEEEFLARAGEAGGPGKARRWYRSQVLRSVVPFLRRRLGRKRRTGAPAVPFPPSMSSREAGRWPPRGINRPSGKAFAVWNLFRDVRFALRSLRRAPLVVLITVASLSLGIGASTAVFTIINAFLFQESTGLSDPDHLVAVYTSNERGGLYGESSFPDYLDLSEATETLDGVVATRAGFMTLDPPADAPDSPPDRMIVEIVSGNYFDVLGIRPPLGRGFLPEETVVGSARHVIVLSHQSWMDRFDGDPGILDRTIRLDGKEFQVIGVAPEGLVSRMLRLKVEGWVPFGTPGGIWNATPQELSSRRDHDCMILGRMAEDATLETVRTELTLLAGRFAEVHPDAWTDDRGTLRTFTVVPEKESHLPPDGRAALAGLAVVLLGGALFILLLACSNVAGLFLARAHRRRREMAVRLSLGAGRGRLAGLLMTESLILGLLGALGGLALAWWFAEFMAAIPLPLDVPLAFDVGLDRRVVLFAVFLSLGAALLFGLAPALSASRPDLVSGLKSESTGSGRRPGRLGIRNLLVLGQVAASVVLLIPAGLFLRAVQVGTQSDVGFDPDRVAILWKEVGEEDRTPEGAVRFFRNLEDRLLGLPGVEDVEVARRADASVLDLADRAVLEIPGYEPTDGRPILHSYTSITPGFVEMMDLPLLRGRGFVDADGPGAPPVAMVNEAFVRRYWPGKTGLDETFTILERREVDSPEPAPPAVVRVVGVIRDTEPGIPGARQGPFLWIPFFQDFPSRAVIHLKGKTSAAEMVSLLRKEVPLGPGETPLIPAQTYQSAIRGRFLGQEMASRLLSWAGLFATALAVMGIYGIVTFAVSQRVREMAIRQAVGAPRKEVLRSLIWEGMSVATIGLVVGLAMAAGIGVLIRSQLFGVAPLDPVVMGGGAGLMVLAAFLATLLPSLRAAKIDPMAVLREE